MINVETTFVRKRLIIRHFSLWVHYNIKLSTMNNAVMKGESVTSIYIVLFWLKDSRKP